MDIHNWTTLFFLPLTDEIGTVEILNCSEHEHTKTIVSKNKKVVYENYQVPITEIPNNLDARIEELQKYAGDHNFTAMAIRARVKELESAKA